MNTVILVLIRSVPIFFFIMVIKSFISYALASHAEPSRYAKDQVKMYGGFFVLSLITCIFTYFFGVKVALLTLLGFISMVFLVVCVRGFLILYVFASPSDPKMLEVAKVQKNTGLYVLLASAVLSSLIYFFM